MSEPLKEPFIRPNIGNQGTRPDRGESTSLCPDIWCAGDKPVFDFQNVLADNAHYSRASEEGYVQGHDNYFYLRFKNGSDKPVKDMCAELYYQTSSLINRPGSWKSIPVEGQKGRDTVNHFDTVKPGAVGVVKAPFLLPSDLAVNESYCIIARIWSHEYPNDFPTDMVVYIFKKLQENMLWGEQNMKIMSVGNKPEMKHDIELNVPDIPGVKIGTWALYLQTENLENTGIKIEVRNSRTDDEGRQICLEESLAKGDMSIGIYRLKEGYRSQMSVYIYTPDGCTIPDNANIKIKQYLSSDDIEHSHAEKLGLLDENIKEYFADDQRGFIKMGEYMICLRP